MKSSLIEIKQFASFGRVAFERLPIASAFREIARNKIQKEIEKPSTRLVSRAVARYRCFVAANRAIELQIMRVVIVVAARIEPNATTVRPRTGLRMFRSRGTENLRVFVSGTTLHGEGDLRDEKYVH